MKRVWLIEIENAKGKPVWRREVAYARFSRARITELVRLLTARAELSFDQIFDAVDRKGPEPAAHLDVRDSQLGRVIRAGTDWSITARLMLKDSEGQLKMPPYPHM
jgi:hypothetical protein